MVQAYPWTVEPTAPASSDAAGDMFAGVRDEHGRRVYAESDRSKPAGAPAATQGQSAAAALGLTDEPAGGGQGGAPRYAEEGRGRARPPADDIFAGVHGQLPREPEPEPEPKKGGFFGGLFGGGQREKAAPEPASALAEAEEEDAEAGVNPVGYLAAGGI